MKQPAHTRSVATTLLVFCLLILTGCATSVRVLAPPAADQRPTVEVEDPVTFTVEFHPRADVSTFRATLDPNFGYPTSGGTDITANFSPPPTAGGTSSAVVPVPPFGSCSLFFNPYCVLEHRLRVEARFTSGRAGDTTGHEHRFLLDEPTPWPRHSPASSSQRTEFFSERDAGKPQRPVGMGTTYQVDLQGQNNFNGTVAVELLGPGGNPLPAGVTAAPLAISLAPAAPNATATLNLSTSAVATPPGTLALQVRATSPSAITRTRNVNFTVTRTPGVFEYRPTTSGATSTCGTVASATYGDIDSDPSRIDPGVTFTAPPGGASTGGIRALYYLFSSPPGCVGVALHPLVSETGVMVEPALSWFNLGLSQNLGAPAIPGRVENLVDTNWHQFWFSADQSLMLLVTRLPLATPTSAQQYRLFLQDAATGQRIASTDITPRIVGTTADPIADICRAELNAAGDTVTISYRNPQGQPPTCPFAANRTGCQSGTPRTA